MQSGQTIESGERKKGYVAATFPNRGFFWIKTEDGQKFFAHQVQVQNDWSVADLAEGQLCTFVPNHTDPRGPNALSIRMEDLA